MSTLIFIRHGETEMAGRFCGHSDPGLNEAGQLQATRVAEEVAHLGIERLYSSDLQRAAQTAAVLSRRIGIPIETRQNLREIFFGLWEGLSWKEIEVRFPQEASAWVEKYPVMRPPEGESYAEFTARVATEIAPFLNNEAQSATTAIVTHRGVISYVLRNFFGYSNIEAWMTTAPYGAVISVTTDRKGENR